MKLTPAIIGFIKGLGIVALLAILSFLGDASHFTGVINNPYVISIIVALVSAFESSLKAKSDNTTALFGAVKISKSSNYNNY